MEARRAIASRSRGFTLLELLSVLALMGLVSALGLSRVSLFTTKARLDACVSEFRAFDAHARLRARTEGPLRLAYDPAKHAFVATDLATEETTARFEIEDDFHLAVEIDDPTRHRLSNVARATSLLIDREGRSLDAEITITLQEQSRHIMLDGLLGTSRVRDHHEESAP